MLAYMVVEDTVVICSMPVIYLLPSVGLLILFITTVYLHNFCSLLEFCDFRWLKISFFIVFYRFFLSFFIVAWLKEK